MFSTFNPLTTKLRTLVIVSLCALVVSPLALCRPPWPAVPGEVLIGLRAPLAVDAQMRAAAPDFIGEDDALRAGELRHAMIGVQIDAVLQIRFIGQLAAIERLVFLGIEQV